MGHQMTSVVSVKWEDEYNCCIGTSRAASDKGTMSRVRVWRYFAWWNDNWSLHYARLGEKLQAAWCARTAWQSILMFFISDALRKFRRCADVFTPFMYLKYSINSLQPICNVTHIINSNTHFTSSFRTFKCRHEPRVHSFGVMASCWFHINNPRVIYIAFNKSSSQRVAVPLQLTPTPIFTLWVFKLAKQFPPQRSPTSHIRQN